MIPTFNIYEFIFLLFISISFATDGSLSNSSAENSVYQNVKGYSQPVDPNDIQIREDRRKIAEKNVNSEGTSIPSEANEEDLFADYEWASNGKIDYEIQSDQGVESKNSLGKNKYYSKNEIFKVTSATKGNLNSLKRISISSKEYSKRSSQFPKVNTKRQRSYSTEKNENSKPIKLSAHSIKKYIIPIKPNSQSIKQNSKPIESSSQTTNQYSSSIKSTSQPTNQYTQSTASISKSTNQYLKPIKSKFQSTNQYSSSTKLSFQSINQYSKPVGSSSQLTDQYLKPIKSTSQSINQYTQSTASISKSTDQYLKPIRSNFQSTNQYLSSIESSSKPTNQYSNLNRLSSPSVDQYPNSIESNSESTIEYSQATVIQTNPVGENSQTVHSQTSSLHPDTTDQPSKDNLPSVLVNDSVNSNSSQYSNQNLLIKSTTRTFTHLSPQPNTVSPRTSFNPDSRVLEKIAESIVLSENESMVNESVTENESMVNESVTENESMVNESITENESMVNESITENESMVNESVTEKESMVNESVTEKESMVNESITENESMVNESVTEKFLSREDSSTSLSSESSKLFTEMPNSYSNSIEGPGSRHNIEISQYFNASMTESITESSITPANSFSVLDRQLDDIKTINHETTDGTSPSQTFKFGVTERLGLDSGHQLLSKISPRRIEISDNENITIYWACPPISGAASNRSLGYDWFKVPKMEFLQSNQTLSPLSARIDPRTNQSVLEIKSSKFAESERYFCISSNENVFALSDIYFYQIVVLKSRWINVGSMDVVSLYINQEAVINCPFGDIIKNNVSLKGIRCSSRMTIKETSSEPGTDVYKCSDSSRSTIKMPSINSSFNCSLSLEGCGKENNVELNRSVRNQIEDRLINLEKCQPRKSKSKIANSTAKRCPGKIFLRYYFDRTREKCFPFETDLCGKDSQSFISLRECEENCLKIDPVIEACFHPLNIGTPDICSSKGITGSYMVTYDMENNICRWFYHCGAKNLSKNVFQNLSSCNQNCVNNEKLIKIEAPKACRYQTVHAIFDAEYNQPQWKYNSETDECQSGNKTVSFLSFSFKRNCAKFCRRINQTDVCKSRPENGICLKKILKWHFDWEKKRCIQIFDGGCGDSFNRFDSKDFCEKMCSHLVAEPIVPISWQSPTVGKLILNNILGENQYTTASISNTTREIFRKRLNRKISVQEGLLTKSNGDKAVTETKIKHFDLLDRKLDFDPCFRNTTVGHCDYGFGRFEYQMTRYAFKSDVGLCYKVQFSGCRSGENLFDDANDCKSICEFRLHSSLKNDGCRNPYSQKCIAGNDIQDREKFKRFFFLPSSGECVEFVSVDSPECLNQSFRSAQLCKGVCAPQPPIESMLQNKCFGKIVISDSSCSEDQKIYMWFFLSDIKQCLQYSTCPVSFNGNTFSTKLDCENSCNTANIFGVCSLSVDFGVGNFTRRRYFYNSKLGKCQLFFYKGSLGNLNRFLTKTECEKVCSNMKEGSDLMMHSYLTANYNYEEDYNGTFTNETWLHQTAEREYCYDPHKYGECSSDQPDVYIKKYYYDAYRKQCEPYMFSGCGSVSRNSFDTLSICDKMCTERITKTVSSLCSHKASMCSESQWMYWTYNPERGVCEPFTSCFKKSNELFFFSTKQHCSRVCVPKLPLKKDLFDICHLPPFVNENCSELTTRWHYNEQTRSCNSSISCDHYGNNFPSFASCMSSCEPKELKNVCQLPSDRGPCSDNATLKFFFDWKTQSCKSFIYGGCLGNRNRFHTVLDCRSACPSKNRCNLNFHNLKCADRNKNNVSNLFIYDVGKNKCAMINGLLCGDYTQLFASEDECVNGCVVPKEYTLIARKEKLNPVQSLYSRCSEKLKHNTYPLCLKSEEWLPRYFYDESKNQCVFFYYNGCNGSQDHGNRFTNFSQCEYQCRGVAFDVPTTTIHQTKIITKSTKTFTIRKVSKKAGFCPELDSLCSKFNQNGTTCEGDDECQGTDKCCPCETEKSTLSICMEPLDCIATRFGCCSDGFTLANDTNHLNCPSRSVKIEGLPEVIQYKLDEDLSLNCFVSGDPKPNITWVYLGNTTKIIPVETKLDLIRPVWSGCISLSSYQYTQGLWSCQAVNEEGWDEKSALIHQLGSNTSLLNIYDFGKYETFVNATVNTKVVLRCPIYGIPRPVIKWYYNRIPTSKNRRSVSEFNRFLLINKVELIDSGIWTCIARSNNQSFHYQIKLRVLKPLQILPPSFGTDIKVDQGHEIILFCNVQVEGSWSVEWYWKSTNHSVRINSTFNGDARILHIISFENQFLGTYVCEAFNLKNRERIEFRIIPYKSDDITINPSGTLFVGLTVNLSCPIKIFNNETPIIWKKNGLIMETSGTKLTLILQSKSVSGHYSCHYHDRSWQTYLLVDGQPSML